MSPRAGILPPPPQEAEPVTPPATGSPREFSRHGNRRDITVRLATPTDDAAIRELLSAIVQPGSIALNVEPAIAFREAAEVHGNEGRTVLAERDGRIEGMGFLAYRPVYVNGMPVEVGYLGGLRIAPGVRGTRVLLKGFGLFRELDRQDARVPYYLTTIMADNPAAQRVLTARHRGLPVYHRLADYHTLVLPVRRRPRAVAGQNASIVRGDRLGATRIAAFLASGHDRRQFWPRYESSDLDSGHGLLRGLRTDHFLAAVQGDRILGTLAIWDQSSFRRHSVRAYSRCLRLARPFANLAARALGYAPPFPPTGAALRLGLVACPLVDGDDPRVFTDLLAAGLTEARARGFALLAIGLTGPDPLLPQARRFPHIELRSTLYAATWRDELDAASLLTLPPYVELGSL